MKTGYLLLIVVVLILVGGIIWYGFLRESEPRIATSFEECVEAGFAVMESYPRQCRDEAGNLFMEDVTAEWEIAYSNASEDLVRDVNIEPGEVIESPLTITGEARGYWFFEASFPITIVDWDGRIIAEHYAEAVLDPNDPDSTWMTEEFVPFRSTIGFDMPAGPGGPVNRGAIILKRDNPSGLPENDAAVEIPILFEPVN